jgi:hypothetical protein
MSTNIEESDYTKITIGVIIAVSIAIVIAGLIIDLFGSVNDSASSFQSSSYLVFVWRILCLSVGLYAIFFMFKVGPGNMMVVRLENNQEELLHPVGIEKFVTFSSWTLLVNVLYFAVASLLQLVNNGESSDIGLLGKLQVILFVAGISMAFLTATVVRHIILPNEVRIAREHSHLFLFHEQIMHNFAAIFLAVEMILVSPNLASEFALFGLFFGIVYLSFAYVNAYYGSGFFAYSFLHPKPKIAPIFAVGLASGIAVFYLGLWLVSEVRQTNIWLSGITMIVWTVLIVQFKPVMTEIADD